MFVTIYVVATGVQVDSHRGAIISKINTFWPHAWAVESDKSRVLTHDEP